MSPGDVGALAELIKNVIKNPEKYAQAAARVREHIINRYTFKVKVEALREIL